MGWRALSNRFSELAAANPDSYDWLSEYQNIALEFGCLVRLRAALDRQIKEFLARHLKRLLNQREGTMRVLENIEPREVMYFFEELSGRHR